MDGRYVYVMPSNPMLVPHHLLVIPKRHVELPWNLTWEERSEISNTIINSQIRIVENHQGAGCDVRQHCRPFLPQSDYKVDHLHWHILPRLFGDELYQRVQIHEKALFDERMLSPEQMLEEMRTLKQLFALP